MHGLLHAENEVGRSATSQCLSGSAPGSAISAWRPVRLWPASGCFPPIATARYDSDSRIAHRIRRQSAPAQARCLLYGSGVLLEQTGALYPCHMCLSCTRLCCTVRRTRTHPVSLSSVWSGERTSAACSQASQTPGSTRRGCLHTETAGSPPPLICAAPAGSLCLGTSSMVIAAEMGDGISCRAHCSGPGWAHHIRIAGAR
jgi:hypothetical protein